MLRLLFRFLLTLSVLLTAPVAGLPLVLCVSAAHGTAIEFEAVDSASHRHDGQHDILFKISDAMARSVVCEDYRLQNDKVIHEVETKQNNIVVANGDAPGGAVLNNSESATTFYRSYLSQAPQCAFHVRSSLSDLRTIVLQI